MLLNDFRILPDDPQWFVRDGLFSWKPSPFGALPFLTSSDPLTSVPAFAPASPSAAPAAAQPFINWKALKLNPLWVVVVLLVGIVGYDKLAPHVLGTKPTPAPVVDQIEVTGKAYTAAFSGAYADLVGPVERGEVKTYVAIQQALDHATLTQRNAFRTAFEAVAKTGCDASGNITSPSIVADALGRAGKGMAGK